MQISLMPDLSLLAVMVIFIMNYLVVRKFFLEPINRVMEEREHETCRIRPPGHARSLAPALPGGS